MLVISIVAVSVILAWTDPQLAKFVWLLFLVVSPVAERISRRLEHADRNPWSKSEESSTVARSSPSRRGRAGSLRPGHDALWCDE